jgi:hypothetical protein
VQEWAPHLGVGTGARLDCDGERATLAKMTRGGRSIASVDSKGP